jgi:hypothetical protein
MSIYKRKMFNMGGSVSSRGVGITSGLTTPRRGYVNKPGSYAGLDDAVETLPVGGKTFDDFFKDSRKTLEQIYEPRQPASRLASASPALLALSSALLSGKSFQGGIGGALDIFGQGLEKSTPYFSDMLQARRANTEADRKEQLNLDLQALQMAREDQKEFEEKLKPFELGDNTLRYNPQKDTYDIIASKPSELIEVFNLVTDQKELVPEALVRADIKAAEVDPNYSKKYIAEKDVSGEQIENVFDTFTERYIFVSQDMLKEDMKKDTPRYVPEKTENKFVTVFDPAENKNIFISESAFNKEMQAESNKYLPKKDGLDTFKEVYSNSLKANIYVTQEQILTDNAKDIKDYSAPKDDPVYKTFYDPLLKLNVLATSEDVTARINDEIQGNEFQPKELESKDTLITLFHKESKRNILTTEKYAIENQDQFDPERKVDSTKAAVDTQNNNKLVFVTNEEIAENPSRYQPAILGQNLTVGADGEVSLKSELVGGGKDDATVKQQDSYFMLEDLNLRTTELQEKLEGETPEYIFGVSGVFVDFYNKYLTQLGLPFNEQAAEIRNDINMLSQTVLRQISQDSRFTNEDREYIAEITGKGAMDAAQSFEQVLNGVSQTQILIEERLSEASGAVGFMPSYQMSVSDLIDSFNNFRLDNGIAPEGTVRRNDLPSFNLEQMKRRLRAFHYDTFTEYYNPDGSAKEL